MGEARDRQIKKHFRREYTKTLPRRSFYAVIALLACLWFPVLLAIDCFKSDEAPWNK